MMVKEAKVTMMDMVADKKSCKFVGHCGMKRRVNLGVMDEADATVIKMVADRKLQVYESL